MKFIKFFVLLLIVLGALNWGLWGFFQYDLIADLFGGPSSGLARFFYALIGLAGVWGISFFWCHSSKSCNTSGDGSSNTGSSDQNKTDQNQNKMDQDQ